MLHGAGGYSQDLAQAVIAALLAYPDEVNSPRRDRLAFGIARRQLALFRRDQRVRPGSPRPGATWDPSDAAVHREAVARYREVLAVLNPEDVLLLKLRHHDQAPFEQAATLLGITPAAARARYIRALQRVREEVFGTRPRTPPPGAGAG